MTKQREAQLLWAAVALLLCWSCACRTQAWRVVPQGEGQLLIPPGVGKVNASRYTFHSNVLPGTIPCENESGPIQLRLKGTRATLTIDRDLLATEGTAWLARWALELEEERCLAPGEGLKLAERAVESVALESRVALKLLHSDELRGGDVDLGDYGRLRVVNPIWNIPGVGLMAEGPYKVTGHDYTLNVTGRSTDNLIGYETTIYAIVRKAAQPGYEIKPMYTDRHEEGRTQRVEKPTVNYLQFPQSAAFYHLFYKSNDNDFTELLVGGRTPEHLDENLKVLKSHSDSASCNMVETGMCIAIRKDVGITPLIAIRVNGTELLSSRGANVATAVVVAKAGNPEIVWRTLKVSKPWKGHLVPVKFHDDTILRVPLSGGEDITSR